MSAMVRKPWRFECGRGGLFGLGQHGGIGFLHHLLAEIHANEVVLKNIVVEHVLGRFAEVHNPFRQRRRAALQKPYSGRRSRTSHGYRHRSRRCGW